MTAGTDVPGLLVRAVPSAHAKCARCWNLRDSVGQNARYGDLCARCAQAVADGAGDRPLRSRSVSRRRA